jgi:hypothetical protein
MGTSYLDQVPGITTIGQGNQPNSWLHISGQGAPTGALGFTGFILDTETAAGVVTYIYFWCDTTGKLRYGTTAPTTATQNSAGTAIGS